MSKENWIDPYTKMEFIWLPGGCYDMGCGDWDYGCENDEMPMHKVCLDGFWIAKFETTQVVWVDIMGYNPSRFNKGGLYPVENITWDEAQDFITKLNDKENNTFKFRLPTEAEWEYACRSGGKHEIFSGSNQADNIMWHRKNSGLRTHPVGEKAPNGFGLFDMSGNVIEWCSDTYHPIGYLKHQNINPNFDGTASSHKVMRGGDVWGSPKNGRCSKRRKNWSDSKEGGIRLVR
jgi:formylglycine-generating enzyme required for sulfatase activity